MPHLVALAPCAMNHADEANAIAPDLADPHPQAHSHAHPHAHAHPNPNPNPNPNPHANVQAQVQAQVQVQASAACLISHHDVQALVQHLNPQRQTGSAGGPHAPPCTGDDLAAWLGTWGQMLALRRTTWPMADLTARQRAQWLAWAQAQADSPCIAVCSTAQGDAICRGCRRSFEEIKAWPALDLAQKRLVWARLLA